MPGAVLALNEDRVIQRTDRGPLSPENIRKAIALRSQ